MSNEVTLNCPHCNHVIDVNEAVLSQLEGKFNKDMKIERDKYKIAITELKAKEEALRLEQENFNDKLQNALQLQLKVKEQYLRESISQEMMQIKEQSEFILREELDKKSREILSIQSQAEQRLHDALIVSKKQQEVQIKAQLENESAFRVKELENALQVKSVQVQELEANKAEIAKLRMENAEIGAKAKSEAQVEFYEILAQEKQKAVKEASSQHELKQKEADEKLRQLQEQLQYTQQKLEQGSMQIQGEAQEHAIEEWLRSQFRFDVVDEIGKGAFGADCIQTVNTREVQNCGKICYESKNTKEWSNSWIPKLKQDMLRANADIGVLVTRSMPKNMKRMGLIDQILVCSFDEFKGASALLRNTLIELKLNTQQQENRTDKMSILYNYLSGKEFGMQMTAIVDGFTEMQKELDKQKKSSLASWKRQQKYIDSVLINTTEMYGSIKGIAGNAIIDVKALELEYNEDEVE